MLVGPPASDGMLDCPHLCGTGLEHRHIETQIALLYLQTSVGDSVFEGSLRFKIPIYVQSILGCLGTWL